jgi:uracil-DNA glycosylase
VIFSPEIWPEECAPPNAINCSRCELHQQRKKVVWGEGNPHAPILALLDNPGARENREGEAYVCATRVMLQRVIHETGLQKSDVYATYLLKCRPIRAYDKPAAREACSGWLTQQIQEKKPKVIMLLGLVVAEFILSLPEAKLSELRGKLHCVFNRIPAVVTYHPLAVHRRPNLFDSFLSDWHLAAQSLTHPAIDKGQKLL